VGPDVTADVRAVRDEDVTLEARNADRRESGSGSAADSDAAGAALLARLGL
jgi:hypothetical protein